MENSQTLDQDSINDQLPQIIQENSVEQALKSDELQDKPQHNYCKVCEQKQSNKTKTNNNQLMTFQQTPSKNIKQAGFFDVAMLKDKLRNIKLMVQGTKTEGFSLSKQNGEEIMNQCEQMVAYLDQTVQLKQQNVSQEAKYAYLKANQQSLLNQIRSLILQKQALDRKVFKLTKEKANAAEQLQQIQLYYEQVCKLKQDNNQVFEKEKGEFAERLIILQQMVEKLLAIHKFTPSRDKSNAFPQGTVQVVSSISEHFYSLFKGKPPSQIAPQETSFQQSSIFGKTINSVCQSQANKLVTNKYYSGIIVTSPIVEQQSPRSSIRSKSGESEDKKVIDLNISNSSEQYTSILQDYPYLQKTN